MGRGRPTIVEVRDLALPLTHAEQDPASVSSFPLVPSSSSLDGKAVERERDIGGPSHPLNQGSLLGKWGVEELDF